MPIVGAAELGAAIGQHALERHVMLVKERDNPVVEQVGGGDWCLAIIELGDPQLAIGIDEGLLMDASNAFKRADVEGVLGAAIAGAFGFEFTPGFLVRLGLFQSGKLAFGKDQAFLRPLGLQRLEPELHGAEVIA